MRLVLTLVCLLPALTCLLSVPAIATDLPPDGDAWTECADAPDALDMGWTTTCGLSQALVVSADAAVGDASVGVTATRAYWCNPFQLIRNEDLNGALDFSFWHRCDEPGWGMSVRVVMEPTAAEAAQGCTAKRAQWSYLSTVDWTEELLSFSAAEWEWNVNGMWETSLPGGDPVPTRLWMVEWMYCSYFGVEIGDVMLLDGLCFHLGDTGVNAEPGVRLALPHPNPANPRVLVPLELAEDGEVTVEVCDLAGRRVAVLHRGPMSAGPTTLAWDGRRDDGRSAPAGVYLVRVRGGAVPPARRFVLAR